MMSICDCPQCQTQVNDKGEGCDLMVSFITTCRNGSPEKEKRNQHSILMRREIELTYVPP